MTTESSVPRDNKDFVNKRSIFHNAVEKQSGK